MSQIPHQA
jgi:hypothetical protein